MQKLTDWSYQHKTASCMPMCVIQEIDKSKER